jgi:hypothetical protein
MMQSIESAGDDVMTRVGEDSSQNNEDVLTTVCGYKVELFNDEFWGKCRAARGVTPRILDDFTFDAIAEGGGKGGDVMAFFQFGGNGYIVKTVKGNDQTALLAMAERLSAHMVQDDTLLSTILWHFRIAEGADAGCYFVMNNCLPVLPPHLSYDNKYDLKGCRDDKVLMFKGEKVPEVHKRCFAFGTCWYGCDLDCCTCNSPERRSYYQGKLFAFTCKFPVDEVAKAYIDRVVGGDVAFLRDSLMTMDYSLIMGTVKCARGAEHDLPRGIYPNQPFLALTGPDEVTAYYFGIIDFLQEWTATKKVG